MPGRTSGDQIENEAEGQLPSLDGGTITRIKQQSKRPDRVSLFIDDHFALGLSSSVFLTSGLRKGDLITSERLGELYRSDQLGTARVKALNFLSYRARTVQEIRDRLAKYGYDESLVDLVVSWLSEQGYLDDITFAEAFVEERKNRKGYGPLRIKRDMMRKGIARETIDAALLPNVHAGTELIAPIVMKMATIRWARLAREDDFRKRKSKLVQYLQRRGFAYAVSVEILDRIMAESEES